MKRRLNLIWLVGVVVAVALIVAADRRPAPKPNPLEGTPWAAYAPKPFEASDVTMQGFRPGITASDINSKYKGLGAVGDWYLYGYDRLHHHGETWAWPILAARYDSEGKVIVLKGTYLGSVYGDEYDLAYLEETGEISSPSRKSDDTVFPRLTAYDEIGVVVRDLSEERQEVYLLDPKLLQRTLLEELDPENVSLAPFRRN